MTDLDRILREQRECLHHLATGGSDCDGAERGLGDWVAEEVLVLGEYGDFLKSKLIRNHPTGFEVTRDSLHPAMFEFQHDITHWALKRGKAALFEDCGLGKTVQELVWSQKVSEHTGAPVLIFAPLAVSRQTVREGQKFGIPVRIVADQSEIRPGINITNYEKLHHFRPDGLAGIVLDESSILKGFDGQTRKAITQFATDIPFRLCATATPAPNDYMELGNHAEFLGIMKLTEMLSMFFIHDGGDTSKWRLKGHASEAFWKWLCSWAVAIRKPSDLGYEDDGFILPRLHMNQVIVLTSAVPDGYLFPVEAGTLQERNQARRDSLTERVQACAELVNPSRDQWIVWCNLNDESSALAAAIPDAIEVRGSQSDAFKESAIMGFISGNHRVLVTKSKICGFGLNMQCCAHVAFIGLSDSYEQFYQAVRRCWRFGQMRQVHCHIITAETEGAVVRNIQRKETQAMQMMEGMVAHMRDEMQREIRQCGREREDYRAAVPILLPTWMEVAQ